MWYVDLIIDFPWVQQANGELGKPKAKAIVTSVLPGLPQQILIYGSETEVHHLRLLYNEGTPETIGQFVDQYRRFWLEALQIAVSIATDRAFVLSNLNGLIVAFGEGTEDSKVAGLQLTYGEPTAIDYNVLLRLFGNWNPRSWVYLRYLRNFLDTNQDMEYRWLCGYKIVESFFNKNGTKRFSLQKDSEWNVKLEEYRGQFETIGREIQTPAGKMEEARRLAAHGIAHNIEEISPNEVVTQTFPILKELVVMVMNQESISNRLAMIETQPESPTFSPPVFPAVT